jgi:hypothetical protein
MAKAGPKRRIRLHQSFSNGCWLDIYDGPWFSGAVRRLRGPAPVLKPHHKGRMPGSVIVGPNTLVSRLDRHACTPLQPSQIIPEFAKQPFAQKLSAIRLLPARLT